MLHDISYSYFTFLRFSMFDTSKRKEKIYINKNFFVYFRDIWDVF